VTVLPQHSMLCPAWANIRPNWTLKSTPQVECRTLDLHAGDALYGLSANGEQGSAERYGYESDAVTY